MHTSRDPKPIDLVFTSLLSGAYGGAAIALFFLAVDLAGGDPFITPSIMGSVLFLGIDPAEATTRLDMFALYTLVHLAAFTALGTAATLTRARFPGRLGGPLALTSTIAASLMVGTWGVDALLFPGIAGAIGLSPLVSANLFASVVMGQFIHRSLESSADDRDRAPAGFEGTMSGA